MTDLHVDGNALGGLLIELFGRDMTDQLGCCGGCGNVSPLGAVRVLRGAGYVMRCPFCEKVALALVATPEGVRVAFGSLRWLEVDRGTTSPS